MYMLQAAGGTGKNPFELVVGPFLQDSGLPFAQVLTAQAIEQAFAENQGEPYQGKQTGETALLRGILDGFQEGEVVVFDRYFCSFMMLTLLAYNLIRKVIATSAAVHGKQPRQLGFTLACQTILSLWMLLSTGSCRNVRAFWDLPLQRIASNQVANRPGRLEPRVLKRRRHRYRLMTRPREELRQNLCTT